MKFSIKLIIPFIALLIISTGIFAQNFSAEEKRILKKARKNLADEKYKDAQNDYLELIKINPKNDFTNFEAGLSYYLSDFEREKSIPYFENALKYSSEDTIPELKYYLGRAYHINGQFEKSKTTLAEFSSFIKKHTKAGQSLLNETNYRIQINDNSINYAGNQNKNIKVKNLGKNINTSYPEYAPVFKKEDHVILFTSRRKENLGKMAVDNLAYEDIYVAKRTAANSWELITDKQELNKYLPKNFNTRKHDAGVIYSADGKTLYTYKDDALWKSIFKDEQWNELEKLNKEINESQFNVPSISVTKDGNTMFFVSYRKDGYGGKDIYKATKNNDGSWSAPENLGPKINTEFDEDAPFLSNNGITFYFSSKGHEGIGGYDIFKSEFINGELSEPINLGIPLNSPLDDIYFVIDEEDQTGFLSSDRNGGNGGMDIYSFCSNCPDEIINVIKGILANNDGDSIDDASISFNIINPDSLIGTTASENGNFELNTNTSGKHQITVNANNYEKQSIYINLPDTSTTADIKINLYQVETETNNYQIIHLTSDVLALNQSDTIEIEKTLLTTVTDGNVPTKKTPTPSNVIAEYQGFFDYNVKEINTTSSDYLAMVEKAVKEIQSGKTIAIQIESSASRVPTKTFKTNINLASLRGEQAKEVLIKTLLAKGFDESKFNITNINAIVSGPKYIGDYKNTEKYNKFQYVKIIIK
ncbi:MAG: PD40 domain-containing protein [Vicingus serpentipes]|nr:PD40 domain-containing protein [Vicingus serpentipes]